MWASLLFLVSNDPYQYVLPLENYKHWQVYKEVCYEKKNLYCYYNEYEKDGKCCRWKLVPYEQPKKAP